jgi:hypothetical protein
MIWCRCQTRKVNWMCTVRSKVSGSAETPVIVDGVALQTDELNGRWVCFCIFYTRLAPCGGRLSLRSFNVSIYFSEGGLIVIALAT